MEDETKLTCDEWLDAVIDMANGEITSSFVYGAIKQNNLPMKGFNILCALMHIEDEQPEVREYLKNALIELADKIQKE